LKFCEGAVFMSTVVIDAGHGGHDSGAVFGGRMEKTDALNMALALRNRLQAQGQRVIMTRSTDVFIPLNERSAISNRSNADLFVSVHRNGFHNPSANGYETFVRTNPRQIDLRAAQAVHNRIVAAGVQSNRGIKHGNFTVLRNTNAPAILLELGFITNARDNQLFDQNFNAYADAITQGVMEFLGQAPPPLPPPPPTTGDPVIATVQRTLNERYGAGLAVDGLCGPLTRRGLVRGLQSELNSQFGRNLVVDGTFGPLTRAAVVNVRQGSRGNIVWIAQAALHCRGFGPGAFDGIFGPRTDAAVRAFQQNRGLSADGADVIIGLYHESQ